MSPIKAVLFDLDDTLWPIVPLIVHAEKTLYAWMAHQAPGVVRQFTIESLRARRSALMLENPNFQIDLWALRHAGLTEAFIASGENAALVDGAMAVFAKARNEVALFADVVPALERLGTSFRLGTISNGFADLHTIGLNHHFRVSLAAHRFGLAKPDSAIFHAACDALGVAPAEAVYVGDDLALDVEGAQKAGMRAVWMNRFDRTAPAAICPDGTCASLDELEEWLRASPGGEPHLAHNG